MVQSKCKKLLAFLIMLWCNLHYSALRTPLPVWRYFVLTSISLFSYQCLQCCYPILLFWESSPIAKAISSTFPRQQCPPGCPSSLNFHPYTFPLGHLIYCSSPLRNSIPTSIINVLFKGEAITETIAYIVHHVHWIHFQIHQLLVMLVEAWAV